MNKLTIFLVIIIGVLSFSLGSIKAGKAQEKSFAGVMPFVTSNDRIGFFDQSSGRIYLYDNNLSQCVFTGQIQSLGQVITAIPNNNPNTAGS